MLLITYTSPELVDNYGSDTCDNSVFNKDCKAQCTSDPMCSPTYKDPPLRSCEFSTNCMEAKVPFGVDGYALHYGMHYCTKFVHQINSFSSEGQTWIYLTMNCLQKALVSALRNCEKNCKTMETLAFDSHPPCYVNSGVCDLPVMDWVSLTPIILSTVFSKDGFVQALKAGSQCIPDIIIRFEAYELGISDVATRTVLRIIRKWLQSL